MWVWPYIETPYPLKGDPSLPKFMKGFFWLLVKFSRTNLEVEVGCIHTILIHGKWTSVRRKLSMKKGMHMEIVIFYSPPPQNKKAYLWLVEYIWEICEMYLWCTRWDQLNSWVPPHVLIPKCANHNELATLQLEFITYSMFLIVYMQRNDY